MLRIVFFFFFFFFFFGVLVSGQMDGWMEGRKHNLVKGLQSTVEKHISIIQVEEMYKEAENWYLLSCKMFYDRFSDSERMWNSLFSTFLSIDNYRSAI